MSDKSCSAQGLECRRDIHWGPEAGARRTCVDQELMPFVSLWKVLESQRGLSLLRTVGALCFSLKQNFYLQKENVPNAVCHNHSIQIFPTLVGGQEAVGSVGHRTSAREVGSTSFLFSS